MLSTHDIINTITGMTPNLPSPSPFAEAWSSGVLILAQDAAALNAVPAEFIKYFIICTIVLGGVGYGSFRFGQRGSKAEPLHLHQPVHVKATVRQDDDHAGQSDLDALIARFDAHVRENDAEHARHRDAQARMMQELLEKGNAREHNIIKAIHEAKDSVTAATLKELKDVHNRINPMEGKLGELTKWIEGIEEQLKTLWGVVKGALKDAHDSMKEALAKKK